MDWHHFLWKELHALPQNEPSVGEPIPQDIRSLCSGTGPPSKDTSRKDALDETGKKRSERDRAGEDGGRRPFHLHAIGIKADHERPTLCLDMIGPFMYPRWRTMAAAATAPVPQESVSSPAPRTGAPLSKNERIIVFWFLPEQTRAASFLQTRKIPIRGNRALQNNRSRSLPAG